MKKHPHSWPKARPLRGSAAALRRQHGAFLITFALFMLFLLGFMGIALDFGRLFVVRTELQTAADSCALAAARELDLQPGAVNRAINAGSTLGDRNGVQFQSGKANQITVGFSETLVLTGGYSPGFPDNKAKYAECSYKLTGLKPWLLQTMAAFSGNSAYASNLAVAARAVATRAPAQSACPIPVRLKQSKFATLKEGDWIIALQKNGTSGSDFGWANLNPEDLTSTPEAQDEMEGKYCNTKFPPLPIGTSGVKDAVFENWNHRFGIYKGKFTNANGPTASHPDYTGYIYTSTNWPSKFNAYSGSGSVQNFITQRQSFTPCGPNCPINQSNEVAVGSDQLRNYGADRRLVLTPVVDTAGNVIHFACMLMLQPIPQPPKEDIYLEYRGNAADPGSPCKGSGIVGGAIGPVVPTLVR